MLINQESRTEFLQELFHFFFSVFLFFFLYCSSFFSWYQSLPLMASALSYSSSTTPSTTTTTTTPIVNLSLQLLSNMVSMMTVKLDFSNYMVWKHQIVVILEAYSMIGFVDDSCEAPDPFLKNSSRSFTREPNLEFVNWKNKEQALFTFINSTLSPSILAITMGQKSVKGVQKVLEKRFAFVS